ncbi:MAG TPA: helix-turn-helix domain-containing protein [Hanamia sp.]|nr:helix-turn-helix domain-containing protein [Hanamia sp.]
MPSKKITYKDENSYKAAMEEILALMNKGEGNLTPSEITKLRDMATAAEEFEDNFYPLPMPDTIAQMVELKMYQMHLTQTKMAELLGLGRPKLSQILNGKREPDVTFLKAAYKKLKIDAAFLLEKA